MAQITAPSQLQTRPGSAVCLRSLKSENSPQGAPVVVPNHQGGIATASRDDDQCSVERQHTKSATLMMPKFVWEEREHWLCHLCRGVSQVEAATKKVFVMPKNNFVASYFARGCSQGLPITFEAY